MGEILYIVAIDYTKGNKTPQPAKFIHYGKEIELMGNHPTVISAYHFLKDAAEDGLSVIFVDGCDLEYQFKYHGITYESAKDVSKEYEEYGKEELQGDSTWAIIRRLYEAYAAEAEAVKDFDTEPKLSEIIKVTRKTRYGLLRYIVTGER